MTSIRFQGGASFQRSTSIEAINELETRRRQAQEQGELFLGAVNPYHPNNPTQDAIYLTGGDVTELMKAYPALTDSSLYQALKLYVTSQMSYVPNVIHEKISSHTRDTFTIEELKVKL